METEITYKVLWVDDQNKDDSNNTTDFFNGWQLKAGNYNIELVPFSNWEDAEALLRKDFDEYSAIILDANCKIHRDDTEQEEFITAVLPSLTNIFGEKRSLLPWYLLSVGTMSNFGNIVKGAGYQHSKHEEDWGPMLYLKGADENSENAPSKLFENIARIAKDQATNVVLYRHYDTFCYLGQDRLIDARARELMLKMLSALYYPEENIKFQYEGNPLRKVLEYMFRSAMKNGLLPDVFFTGDREAVQLASLFMAGYNVRYTDDYGSERIIRWGKQPKNDGKAKIGDHIFEEEIANIVNNIRIFGNKGAHTSWSIEKECKDKDEFFGYVLQMCHVIKRFGEYVAKNNNIEVNRQKINRINLNTTL